MLIKDIKCNANGIHYIQKLSYIINKKERCTKMENFRIPKIPTTTQKCIRFPNDVIDKIENNIIGCDCTFSAFVIAAVKTVLEELEN